MILAASAFKFGIDPLGWKIIPSLDLGPISISPHGIGIAVGFLAGAQLMVRRARTRGGPDENDIWNTLFWALIGAIVGARLGYVLGHFSEVTDKSQDLLGVFKVWEGGISLIGGITGAILFALPYMVRRKMGFWRTMDLAAPGLALGIIIGRIGDLIIGDHLGKPTDFVLGWRCLGTIQGDPPIVADRYLQAAQGGNYPSLGCFGLTVHQTALYDFGSTILLLGLLLWVGRKVRNQGFLILVFTVWYGAMRVITDFLRVDRRYFGLTGSQITALAVGLICLYMLARYRGAPPGFTSAGASPGGPGEPPDAGDREPLVPVGAPPAASESAPLTESEQETPSGPRNDSGA
ncbi:MAG: phosphatidylglycerol---prolipoprotein diacylglyceryl transferase [Actinomycetota bacterium]|nr:phosphatidylglycerol---prolipoprotein diacylglyceryl transferase [Actinomycetota bacterium]